MAPTRSEIAEFLKTLPDGAPPLTAPGFVKKTAEVPPSQAVTTARAWLSDPWRCATPETILADFRRTHGRVLDFWQDWQKAEAAAREKEFQGLRWYRLGGQP